MNNPIINIYRLMKQLLSFILVLSILSAVLLFCAEKPGKSKYDTWKQQYKIQYQSEDEDIYREIIFFKNLREIQEHNSKAQNTYKQGINKFTALTQEQFVAKYLNDIQIRPVQKIIEEKSQEIQQVPDIDWVSKGAVTPIINQGQCGSSWALGAVGAIQGLHQIAYGTLIGYSVQQMIDCTSSYGNAGCNGGLMDNAFKYVMDKGIATEADYPYTGLIQKCKIEGGQFKISGYTDVSSCSQLANALQIGPISSAADATNWYKYKEGVFNDCKNSANHGILIVGIKNGDWVVKNSWGTDWGESGYIRLTGNGANTCNICSYPSYPNK